MRDSEVEDNWYSAVFKTQFCTRELLTPPFAEYLLYACASLNA